MYRSSMYSMYTSRSSMYNRVALSNSVYWLWAYLQLAKAGLPFLDELQVLLSNRRLLCLGLALLAPVITAANNTAT